MSIYAGPGVVASGLVLSLDAGNLKSYPGSGTSLTDLSNPITTVSTLNGPTFSNGVFTFNGTNQTIRAARSDINGGAWAYNQATVCVWARLSSTAPTAGNIATSEGCWEFKFTNQGNGTAKLNWASNPWAWSSDSTAVPNDTWMMVSFRHGVSLGTFLHNTAQIGSTAVGGTIPLGSWRANGTAWPFVEFMGRSGASPFWAKGDFAAAFLYGRELTDVEIAQNFNALRGRFGV